MQIQVSLCSTFLSSISLLTIKVEEHTEANWSSIPEQLSQQSLLLETSLSVLEQHPESPVKMHTCTWQCNKSYGRRYFLLSWVGTGTCRHSSWGCGRQRSGYSRHPIKDSQKLTACTREGLERHREVRPGSMQKSRWCPQQGTAKGKVLCLKEEEQKDHSKINVEK